MKPDTELLLLETMRHIVSQQMAQGIYWDDVRPKLDAAIRDLRQAVASNAAPTAVPTIESVYGHPFSELRPPAGDVFEMRDGRPVLERVVPTKRYLAVGSVNVPREWPGSWFGDGTLFRLSLVPAPKRRRLVYEILQEDAQPAPGQLHMAGSGEVWRVVMGGDERCLGTRTILGEPRIEIEEDK